MQVTDPLLRHKQFSFIKTLFNIFCHAQRTVSRLCCDLNPDKKGLKVSSKYKDSCAAISFSKILDILGSMLTGL